jgi:hypothetical protein
MRMLRYPLAVVAGLVGIFVGVTVVQLVSQAVFPPDPHFQDLVQRLTTASWSGDRAAAEAIRAELQPLWQSVPVGTYVALILSWTGGAVVGGGLAALTAPAGRLWFALAMGVLDSVAIVFNGLLLSPPSWLAPVGVVCTLAAAAWVGWCVSRWAARRAAARGPTSVARA